ncbi:MAG TPA: hypothetical protein VKR61_11750 [Bryobacteraceae bacterium]|nr:hypothetical protein [Bryobacteraceae bacterium]
MNPQMILRLVGLRYQLLWAQTRTRNGRIALFFAGYTFALLIMLLLAGGGFGAGMVAMRSGNAERVAQAVLGGLFLNSLMISVVTGFGINVAFTDAALRRFPLSARERLTARHLTGILEPIWLFALAMFLGLSFGMYGFGTGNLGLGTVGVVLLLMVDYLAARVLATLIEWLSRVRGGTAILFVLLITICTLPAVLTPWLTAAHGSKQAVLAILRYTPPFAAAALMTGRDAGRWLPALGVLAASIAALTAVLVALERAAARPRGSVAAAITWDDRYERVASIFGPVMAPLIGRTLRYYVRSNKVRFNYIAAIPALAFMTFANAGGHGPLHYFVRALGGFTVAGFLGTAAMSTNQFGFDASGFRRYFLLPVPPAAILRASSYTALYLGGLLVAAALVLWLALAPVPFDARMPPMLLGCGLGGLLLFNALAIWTSLLSPRRTDFESTFGNQLSLGGNVLLIGGIMSCIFGVIILDKKVDPGVVLSFWWAPVAGGVAALVFYLYSLRWGASIFVSRRESLLNTIEGRS